MVGFEDIDAGLHVAVANRPAAHAAQGFVVAGDVGSERAAVGLNAESNGGSVGNLAAQRDDALRTVGMNGVGEDDDIRVADGIHPERCAGEAGVAEGADGEEGAAIAGVGRVDVPAEGAEGRCRWRAARARTIFWRTMRERGNWLGRPARRSSRFCAKMATSSAVLKRPAWPATPPMRREVGSWTTPRSMTSPGKVCDSGLPEAAAPCSHCVGAMSGIHDCWRQKAGVCHAQRRIDVLQRVLIERQAGELFDEGAEHDEVDVAVDEALAGRMHAGSRQRRDDNLPPCPARARADRDRAAGRSSG